MTGRWGLLSHAQNAVRWLALFKRLVETSQKHCLSVQLSFIWRLYVAIVIINRHVLLVHKHGHVHAVSAFLFKVYTAIRESLRVSMKPFHCYSHRTFYIANGCTAYNNDGINVIELATRCVTLQTVQLTAFSQSHSWFWKRDVFWQLSNAQCLTDILSLDPLSPSHGFIMSHGTSQYHLILLVAMSKHKVTEAWYILYLW